MKILLTGNLFHDYDNDIKDALEQSGHQVDSWFNNIFGPFQHRDPRTIPQWLAYGVLPHKLNIGYFRDKSISSYNKYILSLIDRNKYDMMIVIGAKTIYPETIKQFRGRKVFWFMDSLRRYEYVLDKLPLFDDLFLFEPTDIGYLRVKMGLEAKFLTLGFNPKRYFPIIQAKQFDYSFVGACYPNRERYLLALAPKEEQLCIYGDFYRSKHRELRRANTIVNAPSEVVNKLYNKTKVNINIHHAQSVEGLNVRSFEIIGSGGLQIVERQKAAIELFEENKEIVCYGCEQEFVEKCRYYVDNDAAREKIAREAYAAAHQRHTWKVRLQEMMASL